LVHNAWLTYVSPDDTGIQARSDYEQHCAEGKQHESVPIRRWECTQTGGRVRRRRNGMHGCMHSSNPSLVEFCAGWPHHTTLCVDTHSCREVECRTRTHAHTRRASTQFLLWLHWGRVVVAERTQRNATQRDATQCNSQGPQPCVCIHLILTLLPCTESVALDDQTVGVRGVDV